MPQLPTDPAALDSFRREVQRQVSESILIVVRDAQRQAEQIRRALPQAGTRYGVPGPAQRGGDDERARVFSFSQLESLGATVRAAAPPPPGVRRVLVSDVQNGTGRRGFAELAERLSEALRDSLDASPEWEARRPSGGRASSSTRTAVLQALRANAGAIVRPVLVLRNDSLALVAVLTDVGVQRPAGSVEVAVPAAEAGRLPGLLAAALRARLPALRWDVGPTTHVVPLAPPVPATARTAPQGAPLPVPPPQPAPR